MESCLKRRDVDKSGESEDGEDSDLEHDLEASLLAGERSRHSNCEHDCGLVSPYKRLRVEDLTHTSAESQGGEGEAHSLLRSHDESDGEFYTHSIYTSDNQKSVTMDSGAGLYGKGKCDASHSPSRRQEKVMSPTACRNLQSSFESGTPMMWHGDSQGGESHKDKYLSLSKSDSSGTRNGHLSGLNHIKCGMSDRGSIPFIDELCMDEDPFMSADEREFPPPPALDKNKRSSLSRPRTFDSLLLASYHPDFQTLESRQVSYHTEKEPSDNYHYDSDESTPQNEVNRAEEIKYPGSLGLLEIHAGDKTSNSSIHPQADVPPYDGGFHYQNVHTVDSEEPLFDPAETPTSEYVELCQPVVDAHQSSNVSNTNDSHSHHNTSHSRSVGTSCSNISSHVSAIHTSKTYLTAGSTIGSDSHRGCTTDDVSAVYDTVDTEEDDDDRTHAASRGHKSSGSSLVKSTVSSGVSTAGLHEFLSGDSIHRSRSSSHHELTANSHSLGSSFESRVHGIRASSWGNLQHDQPPQHNQHHHHYQQPQQQHFGTLERQHSSGSSIKSHPSSCHSGPGAQQIHHHNMFHEEFELHPPNTKNSSKSSKSKSSSSKHKTKGDTQKYPNPNGCYPSQPGGSHDVGTEPSRPGSQHLSSGSLHQQSRSSQGSLDKMEKSYPSSLAVSGHKAKKAVLQSSGMYISRAAT